jgi:hexulose-6-phosphate isomerase
MDDLLSRRSLLKQFAAGAAAAAVLPTDGLAAAPTEPAGAARYKKAVKFQMVQGEMSVREKFELLAELGFEGTEIHVTAKLDRDQVKQASEATGVRVHGFLNSSKPDLKSAIDAAKFYGGDSVLVVAGRVDKKHSYDQVYREQQDRLRAALPYAQEQGIKLLVENVWNNFLLSPLEMARFIDELESPAAGVYFDAGNILRYGWPEHWIRVLGPRIGKIDVKEFSRKKMENEGLKKGFDIEIGDGDCDWPAVRTALAEVGYTSGWATAEVPGGGRDRLAEIKRRMDAVLGP